MKKVMLLLFVSAVVSANSAIAQVLTDSIAEKMLVYQRSIGGWPKAVNNRVVDYNIALTVKERISIRADSLMADATIDNKATTREINYLVKAYHSTKNQQYLFAAERGLNYLFEAQYANGGWPQYYPKHNIYRGQVTYNDEAMMNVMNLLQDLIEGKNCFEVMDAWFKTQAQIAIDKGVQCILNTQIVVRGKLTAWCAQYDEQSLKPAKARAFELVSISGMESVGIVEFLMRLQHPSPEIKKAIHSAVEWFNKSKIEGYDFVFVKDPTKPKGKDRVLVKDTLSTIWARFYDIDSNKPFFSGRDSTKKNTVAEIEVERRVGYAWYGTWPAKLFLKKYPEWLKRNGV